jgi:hypothetical protein
MKIVYHADHAFDAHLVRAYLESEGVHAWVNGEFLVGAMGNLPAQGLVTVAVHDDVADPAEHLVAQLLERRGSLTALPDDEGPLGVPA